MAASKTDLAGNPVLPRVITHWGDGAIALTNRDISADFAQHVKEGSPFLTNVTMTNANAQYSHALPTGCCRFLIKTRDGTAFRVAFVTGKVATPTEPYLTVWAYSVYSEERLYIPAALPVTLYFACGEAGKVAEILAWI